MLDFLQRNRKTVIGAGLVGLAFLAFFVILPGAARRRISAAAQARSAVIGTGPIEVWVTGTGQVEPAALASLSFRVPGTVGKVLVEVGDSVRSGEMLLELDQNSLDPSLIGALADLIQAQDALATVLEGPSETQIAEAELALAQARDVEYRAGNRRTVLQQGRRATRETIEAAKANLVLAEEAVDRAQAAYNNLASLPEDDTGRAMAVADLDRARRARDSALATYNWYTGKPTDIDQAILDAEVSVAQANVIGAQETLDELRRAPEPDDIAAARARVRAAQALVDQVRLIAPLDSTVVAVHYQPGDTVTPGQVGVVLADLGVLHIDTLVDELDIAAIEPGNPVALTFDALPDLTLDGEVQRIDLLPSAGDTTAYPVRVRFTETEARVRLGMTASVNILVMRKESVLLVPNWALGFDPETGSITVRVRRGSELIVAPIELGLRGEAYSEVVSGLRAGDVVEAPAQTQDSAPRGPFGGGG
ncbi:MAG: efflux RND transporter periplasmic adaptor subunit [Anaerolineales bacterium]